MNNYFLPTNNEFIEKIAKAIAKDRLYREASSTIENIIGKNSQIPDAIELSVDKIFDKLWENDTTNDEMQKEEFRKDAHAAINAINLFLITTTK